MASLALDSQLHSPSQSGAALWHGARVLRGYYPQFEVEDRVAPHFAIDIHLSKPYSLEWKRRGTYERTWMVQSNLCLSPANEPISMRWRDTLELLSVHLEPSLISKTAEAMGLRGQFEIPERHGDTDTQVEHICRALWVESEAGYPTGRIFSDSLSTALASRLLKNYGVQRPKSESEAHLSPRSWKAVRNFIEEHLDQNIGLEELAQVAGLSSYYFARCFKATVGLSPHQYIIERRIERARHLLSNSSLSIAHIALQCGFSDQSHLTRHMKRLMGVTPAAFITSSKIGSKNIP
ncbi:virulence regulon transcriptional activator VirF [Abditibacteriota bacterium]|nr:virulence regulon transcriptional activator VirF [Abditibacteriota bacterium]